MKENEKKRHLYQEEQAKKRLGDMWIFYNAIFCHPTTILDIFTKKLTIRFFRR